MTDRTALADEVIMLAGRCGHHFDEHCTSCQSAKEVTDHEIRRLHRELAALRAEPAKPVDRERVARALFDDHWQDDPSLIPVPWFADDGNCICDTERDAWRRSADAAIAAMGTAT